MALIVHYVGVYRTAQWSTTDYHSPYVRNTLTHATQGIERPQNAQNHEILASQAEWTAWEKLAQQYNLGTADFVRRLLNRAVERAERD